MFEQDADVVVRWSTAERVAALKRIVPKAAIGVVLRKTGRGKAPCRRLPRWFVVWFVLVMALFCRDSYQPVFRWLHRFRKGITPGRSTLCEAWQSVGVAPLRLLAEQLIELQAKPDTRQAFYGGLRLMGVDSFVVDVPDTPENVRAFGRPGSSRSPAAFPQARVLSLCELGTHVLWKSLIKPHRRGEHSMTRHILRCRLAEAPRNADGLRRWHHNLNPGSRRRSPGTTPRPSPSASHQTQDEQLAEKTRQTPQLPAANQDFPQVHRHARLNGIAISPLSANKAEGNAATTPITFTITRSGNTTESATVDYVVSGSGVNAATTDDFNGIFPSGSVTFAVGQTSQIITIDVSGDTDVESGETFDVRLTNAVGTAIAISNATGTIMNDDTYFTITAASASKPEGNTGTPPLTFTVSRNGVTTGIGSVKFAVTGSGANPAVAADFGSALPTGTVSFAANETSKTVTISVKGETLFEPGESFTVTLNTPTGGVLADITNANGTNLNDDTVVTVTSDDAVKAEGTAVTPTLFTFTVARSGNLSVALSVKYTVAANGSGAVAAAATDFVGDKFSTGSVAFAAGDTTKLITSAVKAEGNSTSNPLANTAFTFTVTRIGLPVAGSVQFGVTGNGDNPADANDFANGTLPSGTLNFTASHTTQTVTVNVRADRTVEANEGFTVTLANPIGANIVTPTASGTINNDDAMFAIEAVAASKNEGNTDTTSFTFRITRVGMTTGTATVNVVIAGAGTNAANGSDFGNTFNTNFGTAFPRATAQFAANQTTLAFALNVKGDTTSEQNEGFTVTLSNPSGGATIVTLSAQGTILNDD